MNNVTIDRNLDIMLQQIYDNLPYTKSTDSMDDDHNSINKFNHTKILLGGIDSKDVIKKAILVKTVGGQDFTLNSCAWAPAIRGKELAIAMHQIYQFKLIPGVLIRISNVVGKFHLNYFGGWWAMFPDNMQVVTYSTVGKTINTRLGNKGSVVVHKIRKEKIVQIKQKTEI